MLRVEIALLQTGARVECASNRLDVAMAVRKTCGEGAEHERDTMKLAEIWRYPVKSMAGEKLDRAVLTALGIPGDRVVHVEDAHGHFVTSRTRAGLAASWP